MPIVKENLIARYCFDDINNSPDFSKILDKLNWTEIEGYKIAATSSTRNLTNIALREGANIFIASSERGSVVRFKSPSTTIQKLKAQLGLGWVMPYSNLLINNSPGNNATLEEIYRVVKSYLMEIAHV
jgi:hypothetical protein